MGCGCQEMPKSAYVLVVYALAWDQISDAIVLYLYKHSITSQVLLLTFWHKLFKVQPKQDQSSIRFGQTKAYFTLKVRFSGKTSQKDTLIT